MHGSTMGRLVLAFGLVSASGCGAGAAEQPVADPTYIESGAPRGPMVVVAPAEPPAHEEDARAEGEPRETTPGPPGAVDPDERPPRARALVQAEIQPLSKLLEATPPAAADRAGLLHRLADDYWELARVATMEGATTVGSTARARAAELYRRLLDDYSSYDRRDAALYSLGRLALERGEPAQARKLFLELISRHASSRLVARAYLQLGLMIADEAKADPSKLDLARQAFLAVQKYPPPENVDYARACAELGLVEVARGEPTAALSAFMRALQVCAAHPGRQVGADGVEREAGRGLVQAFAAAGDPARSYPLFRSLAGQAADAAERTARWMLALARSYLAADRGSDAATTLLTLLRSASGAGHCAGVSKVRAALDQTPTPRGLLQELDAELRARCGGP